MTTPTHHILATLLPEHTITRLSPDGVRAQTADGSDVTVWWYRTPQQARTVVTALEALTGKQAIPVLRGADIAGKVSARPAVIVDTPVGVQLSSVINRLTPTHIHALGRQLGHLVADIHQVPAVHYGALAGPGVPSQRALLESRVTEACRRLVAGGFCNQQRADALQGIITTTYTDDPAPAYVVHGAIHPDDIWIERSGQHYTITTITGWNSAHGGRPAADHVRLADACAADAYFGLRVGYGEVYDERCQRPFDQLRERVLLPERLVWTLSRAGHAANHAQPDEAARLLSIVQRWCDAIRQSTDPTEEEDL
ncbi:MAG: hypothetical protein RLY87_338 [Chloroflexota bacterium]|jgi:hypothetical protein